jgi:hypothetical protein
MATRGTAPRATCFSSAAGADAWVGPDWMAATHSFVGRDRRRTPAKQAWQVRSNRRLRGGLREECSGRRDEVVANSVPNTQPITPKRRKSFHRSELPGSIRLLPACACRAGATRHRSNLHDCSNLARAMRVRIPDRSRAPRTGAVGFGSGRSLGNRPGSARRYCYRMR